MNKSGEEMEKKIITIPDGTVRIEPHAFENNETLTGAILPDSVTEIGACAFKNCRFFSSVNLGRVKSIGDYAFAGADKLIDIDISSLEKIGLHAFRSEHAAIPRTLRIIEARAFDGCGELEFSDDGLDMLRPVFFGSDRGIFHRSACFDVTVSVRSSKDGRILYKLFLADHDMPLIVKDIETSGEIDFSAYDNKHDLDSLWFDFSEDISANKPLIIPALLRLTYPYKLTREHKRRYLDALREFFSNMPSDTLYETLDALRTRGDLNGGALCELMETFSAAKNAEKAALLLEYEHRYYGCGT